jgi:outer membrane protein OmpA-like peptidoglycan-associated protein
MPRDLILEGDARVEIESSSPMMMQPVGGNERSVLAPVQINALSKDPFGSYIFFTAHGAKTLMRSWSLVISDELGKELRVGPFTRDQITISGNRILDGRTTGEYTAVLNGVSKNGINVRREHHFHLAQKKDSLAEATRYSVLFDFDRSQTAAGVDRFLVKTVAPLIPEYSTVIIHGHTDIIGDEEYNDNLSLERAKDTKGLIEEAVRKSGKRGITFETFGFGSDPDYSPFDNYFPEQRFYNRTVIIDIIPD